MAVCPFCGESVIRGATACPNPECEEDLTEYWARAGTPPASESPPLDVGALLEPPPQERPAPGPAETPASRSQPSAAVVPSATALPASSEPAPPTAKGPAPAPAQAPAVCPRCRAPVEGDARFCNSCGQDLAPACPRCGKTDNRPGAKFCSGCGLPLSSAAPSVPRPEPPRSQSGTSLLPPFLQKPPQPERRHPPRPFHLAVVNRDGTERMRFVLKDGDNQIGARSPGENIQPEVDLSTAEEPGHKVVSRRHAVLRVDGERLTLTDLESTNHTTVNGQRLEPHVAVEIGPEAEIVFANISCRLKR